MSFVTFVRDYIQNPDKIVHIPSFIFDACREFFWYIFSFQWLRNLTYVTLSLTHPENLSSDPGTFYHIQNNGVSQQNSSISLSTVVGDFLASSGVPISIQNSIGLLGTSPLAFGETVGNKVKTALESNIIAPFLLRTQDGFSFLHTLQEKPMFTDSTVGNFAASLPHPSEMQTNPQLSLLTNSAYGFFNGITSNFHFCAITLVIAHIILNENKNRAFKMALISCLGDLSCMIAVLLGFRSLIMPWFAAEPLGYLLGFAIQFYFALEIIKDNRKLSSLPSASSLPQKGVSLPNESSLRKTKIRDKSFNQPHQGGRLSSNRWLIPSLILFSWCEQTQFFQTLGSTSFQPTSTLMGLPFNGNNFLLAWQDGSNLSTVPTSYPFLASPSKGDGVLAALSPLLPGNAEVSNDWLSQSMFSFCSGREVQIFVYLLTYIITRIIFTWIGLSIFQKAIDWKNDNYFGTLWVQPLNWIYRECKSNIYKVGNLISNVIPRRQKQDITSGDGDASQMRRIRINSNKEAEGRTPTAFLINHSSTLAPPKKVQHLLRDPLAIAAVTCSFAFLPSYGTNLLVTKSVGFFPEENRIKHSFFSPWDMPAEVLASDMDFISSHHNLAEYPFFLPFYDKGDYGGWLGVGEEDIRYGPFKLWQTRRIRAPWRRTTLQEPALTYANDKSLFVNPNPNPRKEESTSIMPYSLPLGSSPLSLSLKSLNVQGDKDGEGLNSASGKEQLTYSNEQKFVSPSKAPSDSLLSETVGPQKGLLNIKSIGINEPMDLSSAFLWRTPVMENSSLNTTITKGGRKRLVEGFKKPVRKMSTSKLFNLSSFPSPFASGEYKTELLQNEVKAYPSPSGVNKEKQAKTSTESFASMPFESPSPKTTAMQGHKKETSRIGGFVNTLKEISEKLTNRGVLPSYSFSSSKMKDLPLNTFGVRGNGVSPEVQIKNTKQIRKRFKKFKKRVRLFRSKTYKKRNTKIRRLKHFHYLRNKKKKRRKSRRLIYKLRRQFPYMRNLKERKAEIFGLYSPVIPSLLSPSPLATDSEAKTDSKTNETKKTSLAVSPSVTRSVAEEIPLYALLEHAKEVQRGKEEGMQATTSKDEIKNVFDYFGTTDSPSATNQKFIKSESEQSSEYNINNEKSFYDRGYPKNKNSRNTKKDFNLIFRTQMGERLDFAQEEIRARIFMNPYIRFLLNRRIDNFLSRTHNTVFKGISSPSETEGKMALLPSYLTGREKTDNSKLPRVQATKLTVDAEQKLFKRRLIISKYADAIDFLKPNPRHSYADRIYNHQFKGTLSTARRLFSLKVQFDQPLVHSINYKPVLEHEDQVQNSTSAPASLSHTSSQEHLFAYQMHGVNKDMSKGSSPLVTDYPKGVKAGDHSQQKGFESKINKDSEDNINQRFVPNMKNEVETALLEKSSSAPFYAAWDSELRKLVFTNRYLDHKLATRDASLPRTHNIVSKGISSSSETKDKMEYSAGVNKKIQSESKVEKNHHQQFTSWPLKEFYFKDNEFLVSQLYSNSQPIDSFLSQENEKARSVTLPRRVNSFNTVLSYKNSVPPTEAQRSQQFLKIENNDRKTFLFKHLWTPSNTAISDSKPKLVDRKAIPLGNTENNFVNKNKYKLPTSAEQRKTTRMEEREYPLWMVLRTLAPNQGGFLWPGD